MTGIATAIAMTSNKTVWMTRSRKLRITPLCRADADKASTHLDRLLGGH
ncbi:hypothetical protein P7D22_14875 [Lichenihabitans sp. Uapishka_5]|nr:hypothetical protein [Lichenihabitans sp. Uapishka_5]MDX7952451.1 hypothetical protein [Lichenihabitans sp. Uapishka_5]